MSSDKLIPLLKDGSKQLLKDVLDSTNKSPAMAFALIVGCIVLLVKAAPEQTRNGLILTLEKMTFELRHNKWNP